MRTKFKVGDRVLLKRSSNKNKKGTVVSVDLSKSYPITIEYDSGWTRFDTFCLDGYLDRTVKSAKIVKLKAKLKGSDLELIKSILNNAGIIYTIETRRTKISNTQPQGTCLGIEAGASRVNLGYYGFATNLNFDKYGKLKTVGVWE